MPGTPALSILTWLSESIQGIDASETSRGVSFCGHTILSDDLLVVPTPRRTSVSPTIRSSAIAFYAGCLLKTDDWARIESLCAIDSKPRELTEDDRRCLQGLAVIMADFDHFEHINDTFGHCAGDEVLRESAKRMLCAIRQTDAVGRYGGEEFMAVIRFDRPEEVPVVAAETLKRRNAETPK